MGIIKKIIGMLFREKKPKIVLHYNDNNYPASFENYKVSIGEMLYERREQMIHLSPRDVLICALRDLDTNKNIKNVVVILNAHGENDAVGGATFRTLYNCDIVTAKGLMALSRG